MQALRTYSTPYAYFTRIEVELDWTEHGGPPPSVLRMLNQALEVTVAVAREDNANAKTGESESPADALRTKFGSSPTALDVKKWLMGNKPASSSADAKKVRKEFDKNVDELKK